MAFIYFHWWSSKKDTKGIHWLSWKKLTMSKLEGGLGFKELEKFNMALVAKQGWQLLTNPSSLFARVFKHRYFPNTSFLDAKMGSRPSWAWRSIMWARPIIKHGYRWRIGNGVSIGAWTDPWLPRPISFKALPKMGVIGDRDEKVAAFIWPGLHQWNAGLVRDSFDKESADLILATPLSWRNNVDKLVWHYDRLGCYTVKSGYKVASLIARNGLTSLCGDGESSNSSTSGLWKEVWSLKIPGKLKLFLWQCLQGILPVGSILHKRIMLPEIECVACCNGRETICHVFRDCPVARATWFCSHLQVDVLSGGGSGFNDWWTNLCKKWKLHADKDRLTAEAVYLLWALWKARNLRVFECRELSPILIAKKAKDDADELIRLMSDDRIQAEYGLNALSVTAGVERDHVLKEKWNPPPSGRLKINIDGSWDSKLKVGGLGCVVRDETGKFLYGKAIRVDQVQSANTAEALALREGVTLLLHMNIKGAMVEGDSKNLYQNLHGVCLLDNDIGAICLDVVKMISEAEVFNLCFASRNCNRAADLVSKYARNVPNTVIWVDSSPLWLDSILVDESHCNG